MSHLSLSQHRQIKEAKARINADLWAICPVIIPSTLVAAVSLTIITALGAYCTQYHVSFFDASIRKVSALSLTTLIASTPLVVYSFFLMHLHKRYPEALINLMKKYLHEAFTKQTLNKEFVIEELLKGMQKIDKKLLLGAIKRTYPKKKHLSQETVDYKIIEVLENAIKELGQPSTVNQREEDFGKKMRQLDRMK